MNDHDYGLWPLRLAFIAVAIFDANSVTSTVHIPRSGINCRSPIMNRIAYAVPDMSCQHCVNAVSGELTQVPGVERVDVDLTSKQVVVYGSELDDQRLRTAIANAGYEAE